MMVSTGTETEMSFWRNYRHWLQMTAADAASEGNVVKMNFSVSVGDDL